MPPDPETRREVPWRHVRLHGQRIKSRWRLPHLPLCDAETDASTHVVELSITPTDSLDVEDDDFETLLTTPRATTEERSVFSIGRADEGRVAAGSSAVERLCWDRLSEVQIAADRIDCRVLPDADRHEVEARLFGPAAAYWLERLGHIALHASALALDGRAVVVAGPSGAGKSTTAAAGWSAGARILADDLCGLQHDGGLFVSPGPGWIRLESDTARRFGLPFPRRARRRRGKVRVHLGARPTESVPLAALVLLSPRHGPRCRLKDLSPTDAFPRLQGASYVGPDVARRAGFEASRFLAMTRLLDEVPVYELTLPEGLDETTRGVAELLDRLLV